MSFWFVQSEVGAQCCDSLKHMTNRVPSNYVNLQALSVCVEDLIHPFLSDPIDLVAGIDGTGFVLGT